MPDAAVELLKAAQETARQAVLLLDDEDPASDAVAAARGAVTRLVAATNTRLADLAERAA